MRDHPWETIPLRDHEGHMGLEQVGQLQALNEMMEGQLEAYRASKVMILGIAGGNGLEHVREGQFETNYEVDINASYLAAAASRYPELAGVLECLRADLTEEPCPLPEADLLIADLLVEYIGCESFQRAVRRVRPRWVSCVIQIDTGEGWVSESPYLHVFDGLERVHRRVSGQALRQAMLAIGYQEAGTLARGLPNGKELLRLDFERCARPG